MNTSQMERNVQGFDNVQDNLAQKAQEKQKRLQMIKDGLIEDYDAHHEACPPETLKRENTCLIMEDETMLICIPYEMDHWYK